MPRPDPIPPPPSAEELWLEAIQDAGLDPLALHRFEATYGRAQWWWPGEHYADNPQGNAVELSPSDRRAANEDLLGMHRVAIGPIRDREPDLSEAIFAGLVRHEVEHARQWERWKGQLHVVDVAFEVDAK